MSVPASVAFAFGGDPTVSAVEIVRRDPDLFRAAAERVGSRDPGRVIAENAKTGERLDLVPRKGEPIHVQALRLLHLVSLADDDALVEEATRVAARVPPGDGDGSFLALVQAGPSQVAIATRADASRVEFALLGAETLRRVAPDAIPVLESIVGLDRLRPAPAAELLTPPRIALGLFVLLLAISAR